MNDAQVKHMVSRFLTWQLPEDFRPDGGVSFAPTYSGASGKQYPHNPSGTNLFDGRQAEAMVRHMLEGLPIDTHVYDALAAINDMVEVGDDGYARFGSINDADRFRAIVHELEPAALAEHGRHPAKADEARNG